MLRCMHLYLSKTETIFRWGNMTKLYVYDIKNLSQRPLMGIKLIKFYNVNCITFIMAIFYKNKAEKSWSFDTINKTVKGYNKRVKPCHWKFSVKCIKKNQSMNS